MFSSSEERLIEAVYKKHGFDTAIDILLYSTPDSGTKTVSVFVPYSGKFFRHPLLLFL